jgi:RNA recognition motif-containing protein
VERRGPFAIRKEEEMSRLYVGNISYNTTEEMLRSVFEEDGRTVESVAIITDRETGQSRGFAFVEMASPADAEAAISALDGRELDGRRIRVNEARERSRGGGGGRGPRGGGGGGGGGYGGGGGGGYGGGGGGGGGYGGDRDGGGGGRGRRGRGSNRGGGRRRGGGGGDW